MLEVILDTETTGLSVSENHKIVEIGCIELKNQIATGKIFHKYINPQRPVSIEAYKVHGYSDDFLSDKETFSQIGKSFIDFIKDKKIIIHNAAFDLSFLNHELKLINLNTINKNMVVDTLELARQKYPGAQNSLDALCKRFNIDNLRREKHSALMDCELLKEVYINILDQKEPKFNFLDSQNIKNETSKNIFLKKNKLRKIIKINSEEKKLHKNYLKDQLSKNYFG